MTPYNELLDAARCDAATKPTVRGYGFARDKITGISVHRNVRANGREYFRFDDSDNNSMTQADARRTLNTPGNRAAR